MKYTKAWFAKWEDEEYCLKKVGQNVYKIKYIKNPSERICKAAVQQDGVSTRFTYRNNIIQ